MRPLPCFLNMDTPSTANQLIPLFVYGALRDSAPAETLNDDHAARRDESDGKHGRHPWRGSGECQDDKASGDTPAEPENHVGDQPVPAPRHEVIGEPAAAEPGKNPHLPHSSITTPCPLQAEVSSFPLRTL